MNTENCLVIEFPPEALKRIAEEAQKDFRTPQDYVAVRVMRDLGLNGGCLSTQEQKSKPLTRTGATVPVELGIPTTAPSSRKQKKRKARGHKGGAKMFRGRLSAQYIDPVTGKKICSNCRVKKVANARNFHKSVAATSGYSSQCRRCHEELYPETYRSKNQRKANG